MQNGAYMHSKVLVLIIFYLNESFHLEHELSSTAFRFTLRLIQKHNVHVSGNLPTYNCNNLLLFIYM